MCEIVSEACSRKPLPLHFHKYPEEVVNNVGDNSKTLQKPSSRGLGHNLQWTTKVLIVADCARKMQLNYCDEKKEWPDENTRQSQRTESLGQVVNDNK